MRRILILVLTVSSFFAGLVFPMRAQNINISYITNKEPNTSSTIFYGDVWGEGDIACLGIWKGYAAPYGVGIYDISNPANPVYLSNYIVTTNANHNQFELGVVRNKIGYFGSWSGGGLHIVSLTNAATPVRLAKIGSAGGANGFDTIHTVFLERNFLYEAAHVNNVNTVKVIDVSNPSAPFFVRNIVSTNAYKVHQITAVQKGASTILYTSDFGNGGSSPGETDIWDVTDVGTQPAVWLGRIVSGASSHSSWPTPDGNTLVVCQEFFGGDVRLYDISNPANPVLQTVISTAGMGLPAATPHNPVVMGNLLFLSWYQNGIQIFDITDRTKPVHIGRYDTFSGAWTTSFEGNWGVFPNFGLNKLLLSDIQSGFYILDASAVLTGTNNYPPLIVSQPGSLTITQGINATFTATATGSSLKYQWKFNGANISGATGSNFLLTNTQPVSAGNYTVQVTNTTGAVTSSIASLTVLIPEEAMEVVFYEDFDSMTSSNNWNLFEGSGNGTLDYTVNWSYDYNTFFSTFNGINIPSAPNTTNSTTRGLRLTVNNNDGTSSTVGVSLYPKTATFSGAYKLKLDMWMNYPGVAGGTGAGVTGSTENATFGINHAGTRVNWASGSYIPSDGTWFTVDGEGGDSNNRDYRAYVGSATTNVLLTFAESGFSAAGAASANNSDSYWQSIFPSPTYETSGSPGKKWVQVEVARDTNNILKWKMNDHLIAQRTDTSTFTNGTIMIGYMDLFSSIAGPAADSFVLFDNVRVEAAVAATSPQISAPPQNAAIYQGQEATFTVAATGTGSLTYQWRFNDVEILNATDNSLMISNAQPEQVGNYSVAVANAYGAATSSNATLTIIDSPYLSNIQATPGGRGALISWKSIYPSDSQVQFEIASAIVAAPDGAAQGTSFGSSSYIDRTMTTNHAILLSGLTPDTRYSFQVVSSSETNSYYSGVYQFSTAGTTIIDNPDATFAGTWTLATTSSDKYLADYQFASSVAGTPTANATFRPNLPATGNYNIHVWYPQGGNRATNAPFAVSYNNGSNTFLVNQQINGGQWNLLNANVPFSSGNAGFVRLANNASNSVVLADAVKFTYIDAQETPNGNNIPAWWGSFYGVTNPLDDPDLDGYTTAEEFLLGTSPIDGNSHLDLQVQSVGDSANITFWPYIGNRTYELLFKTNLADVSWQVLSPGAITPTPYGHGIFSLSTSSVSNGFYRLGVTPVAVGDFSGKIPVPKGDAFNGFSEAACGLNRVFVTPRRN